MKEPGLEAPNLGRKSAPLVLAVAGLSAAEPPLIWALLSAQSDGRVMKLLSNKVAGAIEYVGEPVAATANDPATARVKSALAGLVNSGAAKIRAE